METQKQSNILRRMIPGLILGFVIMLALTFMGDVKTVGESFRSFKWGYMPAVLGLTLLNYLLRFLKWHFYLGQCGAARYVSPEGLRWSESMRMFIAGFPLAVTPGKVGEALKGVWLNHKTGLPVGQGVSVVVAERVSDGLAVLGLSTLGVIAYPQYWPGFAAVLAGLLGVVVLSQIRPLALWMLDLGECIPLLRRFMGGVRDFYEGSFALFKPWVTLGAVALGLVSWLGEGMGFYLILLGLGEPASIKTMAMAVFVLSFSTVIGAVSALPGGIGASEASIAGMLVLIAGISGSSAASATLLIRLATLWFGVGLGLVVWVFSRDLITISPIIKKSGGYDVEGV
jgi:glycosyltransferase 2 family protein